MIQILSEHSKTLVAFETADSYLQTVSNDALIEQKFFALWLAVSRDLCRFEIVERFSISVAFF